MLIHTIDLGFYNKINIDMSNIKIWNDEQIKKLILDKYPKFTDYYNKLTFIKSRENLAKLFILQEFGGLYINIHLLTDKFVDKTFLINSMTMPYDFVFWKNHYQQEILLKIYNINDNYLSDEIIYVKKTNSLLFNYLIENININYIPKNQLENKIFLGDVYISSSLNEFCKNNNNSLIKIKSTLPISNIKYKSEIYQQVDELENPDIYFSSWANTLKAIVIIQNIIGLYLYTWKDYKITIIYLLLISVIDFIIIYWIKSIYLPTIYQAFYDNQIFFNPNNFKILEKIIKNWKIIADEAKYVLDNAPKLNITRKYDEWNKSFDYIKKISGEYGWIKSWKYSNEHADNLIDQEQKNNPDTHVNLAWENFGLVHSAFVFKPNVKKCPKTYKLLKSIKKHINISGFSYMKPNCLLEKHTDETGLKYGSLAFHLGLIIPQNENSCKLVIKSHNNKLFEITEKNGKSFVFDANYEHYAYNQSNEDRVILYIDFKV